MTKFDKKTLRRMNQQRRKRREVAAKAARPRLTGISPTLARGVQALMGHDPAILEAQSLVRSPSPPAEPADAPTCGKTCTTAHTDRGAA